ncbi:hypothetical protein BGZ83_010942 [Gryganskiella cystojenkinii]|nr:hypothetical protein BGZ83_010942 [Gryganskiella cystojenkinii]
MLRTQDEYSTARLDHLAELATTPTHSSFAAASAAASSSSSHPSGSHAQPQFHHHNRSHPSSPLYHDRHPMDDPRGPTQGHHPSQGHHSQGSDRYPGPPSSSSAQQQHSHYQQQQQHQQQHPQHSSYGRGDSRSHPSQHQQSYQRQQQDQDANAAWRSPITPTTTNKFNRMAIHEVLDGHQHYGHEGPGGREDSPPYKRKGSPDEYAYSDPPPGSSSAPYGPGGHHGSRSYGRVDGRQHGGEQQRPLSPRFRQESPMPGSNSEDEDDDIRNYKKRRMAQMQGLRGSQQQSPPSTSPGGGPPEVLDQVRSTLKLKQQQKAIIESRQGSSQQPQQQSSTSQQQQQGSKPNSSNGGNQPVTETTPSGLSVFHGSASFASLNRRPQPSPKNPKNAKSLTIFAPSYSESSLSIHSAPLQPSQSHQAMSMNPRTSQPLRQHPHPYALHTGGFQQPLRSPRTVGHSKKPSRVTVRQPDNKYVFLFDLVHCDLFYCLGNWTLMPPVFCLSLFFFSRSGTLPAPILSSHTGPLPSPSMYPPTPFHSGPKQHFLETVSTLFDSVDSSRNLKYTLEEQIRKSAQLLQTLQSSGTMIENLVRGQFKELEKGVIERFEGELEHLSARIRQLEEHQGLTPPPRRSKTVPVASSSAPNSSNSNSNSNSNSSSNSTAPSSSSAMTGVVTMATVGSGSTLTEAALDSTKDRSPTSSSGSPNSGTLPTPPLTKAQDPAAMDVEEDDTPESTEYQSSVQKLQERVETLEAKKE